MPIREDQNRTGPGEVLLTIRPMISMGNAKIPISARLRVMSRIRLINSAGIYTNLMGFVSKPIYRFRDPFTDPYWRMPPNQFFNFGDVHGQGPG